MATDLMNTMTTDVNVGMTEVVSVFVAKYEDGLFAKKDELSKRIKETKKDIADLVANLEGSIAQSVYETTIPVLGLTTKVSSVTVNFDGHYSNKKPVIVTTVGVFDNSSDSDYASFSKTFLTDIPAEDVALNKSMKVELEGLNAELMEVMGLIKTVSRKERQIRGKIAEMKLEQSGMSEMLANPEMLKLVQLN
jgi:hypothetical protein